MIQEKQRLVIELKNLQDLATEYEKKVKILQEDQSKKDNTISDLQQALGVLSARNDEVEDENVALKETIQHLEAELTSKNDSPVIKSFSDIEKFFPRSCKKLKLR